MIALCTCALVGVLIVVGSDSWTVRGGTTWSSHSADRSMIRSELGLARGVLTQ